MKYLTRLLPALLVLSALPVHAATHVVNIVGLTFSPADITINVGDTVRWENPVGLHSVTSGTGALDPNSGALFNRFPFNGGETFEYTFTAAGDVPYYCIPHEGLGMLGIVRVVGGPAVPMFPGGPALLIMALGGAALFILRQRQRATIQA